MELLRESILFGPQGLPFRYIVYLSANEQNDRVRLCVRLRSSADPHVQPGNS